MIRVLRPSADQADSAAVDLARKIAPQVPQYDCLFRQAAPGRLRVWRFAIGHGRASDGNGDPLPRRTIAINSRIGTVADHLGRIEEAEPLIAALEGNGTRLDRPWMLAMGAGVEP
jgi:hypothetical protein